MTDDLIASLAANVAPVSSNAMRTLLLRHAVAGTVAGLLIMLLFMGLREDLGAAMTSVPFWTKLAYAAMLIIMLTPAIFTLSRPMHAKFPWLPIGIVMVCLGGTALFQWTNALPEQRVELFLGQTALVCPWLIVLISLPTLASLLGAMRRFAPIDAGLAGFTAGTISGGVGVLVYSLHCPEAGIAFIATWYTLGILITGMLGLFGGLLFLRW